MPHRYVIHAPAVLDHKFAVSINCNEIEARKFLVAVPQDNTLSRKVQLAIMVATIEEERRISVENKNIGGMAVVRGTDGWRPIIAAWPKVMRQLVGLTAFNTY